MSSARKAARSQHPLTPLSQSAHLGEKELAAG
jgi:hypothetical protein